MPGLNLADKDNGVQSDTIPGFVGPAKIGQIHIEKSTNVNSQSVLDGNRRYTNKEIEEMLKMFDDKKFVQMLLKEMSVNLLLGDFEIDNLDFTKDDGYSFDVQINGYEYNIGMKVFQLCLKHYK